MTFIAGVVSAQNGETLAGRCREMLACVPPADSPVVAAIPGAAFGQAMVRKVPEDAFDRGPISFACGRFILTGDIRTDNRAELIAGLDLAARDISDAELFARVWERYGLSACHRVVGDYVVACYDSAEQQLYLGRSVSSIRPLLFRSDSHQIVFATLLRSLYPQGLGHTDLSIDGLAQLLGGDAYEDGETAIAGLRLVRPGTMIVLSATGRKQIDLWPSARGHFADLSFDASAERLRSSLREAVACRLRRTEGQVASQLSAGRDSSAVTAVAARLLARESEEVIAVTGAPSVDYDGGAPGGRLADESILAGETARFHPNIRHLVCRAPNRLDLADALDELHATHFGPVLNPGSLGWWMSTLDGALDHGASIVLTGGAGNLTISAGGGVHLHDLFRSSSLTQFVRQVLELGSGSPATRRNMLRLGLGGVLPPKLYLAIQRARGRGGLSRWKFFSEPLRSRLLEKEASTLARWTPGRNGYDFRLAALKSREPAELIFRHGQLIELRDPTADRRVVEASLSIPPKWLTSRVDERPLYRAAFGTDLPQAVLGNRVRGYQGADWHRHFSRSAVAQALARYRNNSLVREIINIPALDGLVAEWAEVPWNDDDSLIDYRHELGLALTTASFLHVHFN